MADLQSQPTIADNTVVTSKAETPVVVNQQSLLSALSYLRTELEKLKKENKELSTERTTLFEQLETERNKNIINNVINSDRKRAENNHSNHNADNSEDSAFSEGDDDNEEKKLIEKELRAQIEVIEKEKKEAFANIANEQQEREKLQLQLDQTREEKKQLEVQHQSLIAKLANFKTSIADKLKADNVWIIYKYFF